MAHSIQIIDSAAMCLHPRDSGQGQCSALQLSWDGKGPLGADQVWSFYNLKFSGGCMESSLDGYGEGFSGVGPPSIVSSAVSAAG